MRTPDFWSLEGETVDGDLIYKTLGGTRPLCDVIGYAKEILKENGGGHIDIFFEGDKFVEDVEV